MATENEACEDVSVMYLLLKMGDFNCHVSSPEGTSFCLQTVFVLKSRIIYLLLGRFVQKNAISLHSLVNFHLLFVILTNRYRPKLGKCLESSLIPRQPL